jgi:hypothetical protein
VIRPARYTGARRRGGRRRYRVGPAIVAWLSLAVGALLLWLAVFVIGTLAGLALSRDDGPRPTFVTPSPIPAPPRR